jgi:hypothetical protein
MKLYEEFKIYENMWEELKEELTESEAVIYFDQERIWDDDDAAAKKDYLVSKVKAENPGSPITIESSPKYFIQSIDQSEEGKVKFYTDAEGLKELEANHISNFPQHLQHLKDKYLNKIILVK